MPGIAYDQPEKSLMEWLLDAISLILLMAGTLLGVTGAIGMFRLPDLYTRLHAAGVTDTLCAGLIISGLILQAGFTLISVKLIFILAFLWYSSPVASHAVAHAAYRFGDQKPVQVDPVGPDDAATDTTGEDRSTH